MHIRNSEHFENDKFIYQLWHHKVQCELAHDCTMGWCSKEGEKPYFQMRARAYRLHLANVATGELAFYWAVNVHRIFYGVPKSKPRLCLFAFERAET